jgi:hypothetical protein
MAKSVSNGMYVRIRVTVVSVRDKEMWNIGRYIVATRSKAWVFARWLAGIVGSNPAGAWMPLSSECCVFSDFSATGRSLVQRSPTDRGASERYHGTSTRPTRAWSAAGK